MSTKAVILRIVPGKLDLEIQRGDDVQFGILLRDKVTGEPLALPTTGWSADIRAEVGSPVLASFAIDSSNAGIGIVVLSLPSSGTAILPETAVYDVQCTEPTIRTWISGIITPEGQVTL